jgi:hypothetical protein
VLSSLECADGGSHCGCVKGAIKRENTAKKKLRNGLRGEVGPSKTERS